MSDDTTASSPGNMTPEWAQALNLAEANRWALFPIGTNVKTPWPGFPWRDDSTTDTAKWAEWFTVDGATNIGLDTGKSGLVVVDIDPRAGGVLSTLNVTRRDLLLRDTLTIHTRGDGLHLYYQAPPGHRLGNTTGRLPGVGNLPGIDLRADGGYIVYPSSHVDAKTWRFVDLGVPIALAPSWMREPELPTVTPTKITPEKLSSAYIEAAVRDEVSRVAHAQPGIRNHTLNSAAFSLAQLVGQGGLQESHIEAALSVAAANVGLTASEIAKTITSGIKGGQANPRGATP